MLQQHIKIPKQLLTAVRNGDYAHPGEEQAIEIVMKNISKIPSQLLLDIGCGMGGTAKYIKDHGWGTPFGIDIDEVAIYHAQTTYPDITFLCADVVQATKSFSDRLFDIIYLFNSFYAFINQELALKELYKLGKSGTQLVLFDYMQPKNVNKLSSPFAPENSTFARKNFTPICESTISKLLIATGWEIRSFTNMRTEYIAWYTDFISNLKKSQHILTAKFGLDMYKWAEDSYSELLHHLDRGALSGCTITASRS